MLDIYWLGGGLDWISNVCHAVPCPIHCPIHNVSCMGADNSGVTESRHEEKRWWKQRLCHFHKVPGSVLALLCVPSAYSHTTILCFSALGKMVLPLKSALFPLHLHLCNWDPDLVQGDRSFFCPLLFFVAEVLLLKEHVMFHWYLNQHRHFHYGLKLTWFVKSNIS